MTWYTAWPTMLYNICSEMMESERLTGGRSRSASAGGSVAARRPRRVHDEVDPQHLHRRDRALLVAERADDRAHDRGDVHRQLELQELADGLEDVASPTWPP